MMAHFLMGMGFGKVVCSLSAVLVGGYERTWNKLIEGPRSWSTVYNLEEVLLR
jgi:hypothetical protein